MLKNFGWDSNLRLASGLTMFTYIVTHLINHALGLISLDVMLAGQRLFFLTWHSLPGTILLFLAFVVHLTLVLRRQVTRHTLRMSWVEILRILLGITTLYLLLLHATKNLAHRLIYDTPVLYPDFLLNAWQETWDKWEDIALISAAWIHGCIGLHLWLRLRPGYRRLTLVLFASAVLLPVLALLGIVAGEREAMVKIIDPAWMEEVHKVTAPPDADLGKIDDIAILIATLILAVLIAVRVGFQSWRGRQGYFTVAYPAERKARLPVGASVLDASNAFGIPHASVCGGRARCTTCRVHVDEGWERLPAPDPDEARLLGRIRAGEKVRLACQLRPTANLAVTPLLPANADIRESRPFDRFVFGAEREIVILFSDLRGFTKMSENKLPYDIVHILNQYFAEMGRVIEESGGHLDKFIGDGIMALFGLSGTPEQAARQALAAARGMGEKMEQLNHRLIHDLTQPLKVGIGIHGGTVIVGEMGYGRATTLTAIGDAVNVASRLESATKEVGCQLIISGNVAQNAGLDPETYPKRHIAVRGRNEPLEVYAVQSAASLNVTG